MSGREPGSGGPPGGGEAELIAGLRAGEAASYEALVRAHGGRMLAVARRIVGDRGHAEDCVQEAFLRAYRGIERFEGRAALGTWLHRIVVNVALTRARSTARHEECAIEDLLPSFDAGGCRLEGAQQRSAGAEVEAAELGERVRACIERLPGGLRNVVVLRDVEGFDTAESAELLGISPGAVKVRLHRARAALKSLLERELGALG